MRYQLCYLSRSADLRVVPLGWLTAANDSYLVEAEQLARELTPLPDGQMIVLRHFDDNHPAQVVAVECCSPTDEVPRGYFELTSNDLAHTAP